MLLMSYFSLMILLTYLLTFKSTTESDPEMEPESEEKPVLQGTRSRLHLPA